MPHPIPYQGSKRHLATTILNYLPDRVTRLVEPFAGSGALTLAAAAQSRVECFLLNDINAPLISLWREIVLHPEQLSNQYERLWHMQIGRERSFYDLVRSRFNHTHQPYYLLYLLARCVKASVRYNALGKFNQSPDNRRKGRQPKTMRQDILGAARLLKGRVTFGDSDYRQVLQNVTADDVVYLDPPYQGVCANRDSRYLSGIAHHEFVTALADLNTRSIPYVVSYDGRTGSKQFGERLPNFLKLNTIELDGGRSSQSTLLGRVERTYEALHLSPALVERLPETVPLITQMSLFGELA